jgi:hypothetical protein
MEMRIVGRDMGISRFLYIFAARLLDVDIPWAFSFYSWEPVLLIPIRMFFGLLDPDPPFFCKDPDPK